MRRDRMVGGGLALGGLAVMVLTGVAATGMAPETGGASALPILSGLQFGAGLLGHELNLLAGSARQSIYDDAAASLLPPEAALAEIGR